MEGAVHSTERLGWIRRFIYFHDKRHPAEMGREEITRFLSSLAVEAKVSASTQNQELNALLFLYREVLDLNFPALEELLGHRDLATTMVYTHVVNRGWGVVRSPLTACWSHERPTGGSVKMESIYTATRREI